MRKITLKNFAKVNPVLEILGRDGETGMHFISTVLLNIDHFDLVTVEKTDESIPWHDVDEMNDSLERFVDLQVSSDSSHHLLDTADRSLVSLETAERAIPLDMNNTCARAWELLCRLFCTILPVKITIMKRIPVEAGLGGASGNAAATLVALVRLFDIDVSSQELTQIASAVGADVPFFLSGGLMHGTHFGEQVTDLGECPQYYFIVIKPKFGSNTGTAYRQLSEMLGLSDGIERTARTTRGFINALNSRMDTLPHFRNDFDAYAAKSTVNGRIFAWLQKRLADRVIVAGSGSSIVGVYRTPPSPSLIISAMNELDDIIECAFLAQPVQQGIEVVDWE